MNRNNNYDKFELKWSISILKKRSKDGSEYWHFLRYKEETESFEGFFNLLQSGDKYITANYIINGNDFAQYINFNFYKRHILDGCGNYYNLLTYCFNSASLKKDESIKNNIYLPLQRLALKQILAEKILYEDIAILFPEGSMINPNQTLEEFREEYLQRENEDVTLYCCSHCADRECGYYPVEITKDKKAVIWKLAEKYHRPYIFERQEYENAFADFKEFVDNIKQKKA